MPVYFTRDYNVYFLILLVSNQDSPSGPLTFIAFPFRCKLLVICEESEAF